MDTTFASQLQLSKKNKMIFEKAGLNSPNELAYFFPKRYDLYNTNLNGLTFLKQGPLNEAKMILSGTLKNVQMAEKYCKATLHTQLAKVTIMWFNKAIYHKIQYMEGRFVFVQGTVTYNSCYHNFMMTSPINIDYVASSMHIILPIYKEIGKIPSSVINSYINYALDIMNLNNIIPNELQQKYHLVTRKNAFRLIHNPQTQEDITQAKSYFLIESLYLFSKEMQEYYKDFSDETSIKIEKIEKTMKIINSLPFSLTQSQKRIIEETVEKMKMGKRIQTLVQGDVSCGKTLIAQILMLAVAENGYQAALIAPTTVLAEQHFSKLQALIKEYPEFKCVFLTGEMKAAEKKKIMKSISSGEANLIVGTTSLLSSSVTFANLGITIADEEHRFGVQQKEELKNKGKNGVHIMNMSATPIPRSLTQVMFSGFMTVETVTDMPPGRVPVKTLISQNDYLLPLISKEISLNHKIYVICPQIDINEEREKTNVEETYEWFQQKFGKEVEKVTGKMKAGEIQEKIKEFRDGQFHILISTTGVEVGVDVPDATMILIEDADMFGLSQSHQLRGRVGRSNLESFCYLIPSRNISETGKERLNALCNTNDGMKIAEEDMRMRGSGNIVGVEQSGQDVRLLMAMQYPNTFHYIHNYINGLQ